MQMGHSGDMLLWAVERWLMVVVYFGSYSALCCFDGFFTCLSLNFAHHSITRGKFPSFSSISQYQRAQCLLISQFSPC